MAHFERYIPKMSDDINETVKNIYKAYSDVVDQLDWLLNQRNLDSRNIREIDAGIVTMKGLAIGDNVDSGSVPQVFSDEPTTPYRVNDIWIDGEDLMRCKTARASGAYNAADWELGTNYTDPTGVTTIVEGVVTTDYMLANGIAAYSVAAENITGTTITGKTIQTGFSGTRAILQTTGRLDFYINQYYCGAYSTTMAPYGLTVYGQEIVSMSTGYGGSIQIGSGGVYISGTSTNNRVSISASAFVFNGDQLATQNWVTQNFGQVPAYTGYSTITATTGNGSATHNHGFAADDYIQCYDAGGNPTSKKAFVASGNAHTHTVTASGSHRHTI